MLYIYIYIHIHMLYIYIYAHVINIYIYIHIHMLYINTHIHTCYIYMCTQRSCRLFFLAAQPKKVRMWCISSTANTTLTRRWHPRGGKCEKQLDNITTSTTFPTARAAEGGTADAKRPQCVHKLVKLRCRKHSWQCTQRSCRLFFLAAQPKKVRMWCISSTANTTLTRRWHPRGGKCEKQLDNITTSTTFPNQNKIEKREESHIIPPNLVGHLRSEKEEPADDGGIAEEGVWNRLAPPV